MLNFTKFIKGLPHLSWNEEFLISFKLDGRLFSTPSGRGFNLPADVYDEVLRLRSKGAKFIKVSKRVWN